MNLSKKTQALIALCITALGYSLLSVVARLMSKGFTPYTQVYLRIGLGFVLSLIIFGKDIDFKKIQRIGKKDWLLLLLMGTVGYGLAVGFVTLGVL
ncbi:MAG: EamA family transporter, partial [Minisyncoccia bacterium]